MTAATQALGPALHEARGAEAVIADRFTAHAAVTPFGEYRTALERSTHNARDHVRLIDQRLSALQRYGRARWALNGAWHLTTAVVRVPFDVAFGVPTAMLRRTASEHQMLKYAEEEYAVTAYAVAAGRAGEVIARQTGDKASADLLRSIREDDEQLLTELDTSIQQRAKAAATAPSGKPAAGAAAAARSIRDGAARVLGTAEDGITRVRRVSGMLGRQKGPVPKESFPIADYDHLTAREIIELLPRLSQDELATVDAYERAHTGRSTIVNRAARLLGPEPWVGYDHMNVNEICSRLRTTQPHLAHQILDYERCHRARSTVLAAAARRIGP